MSIHTVIAAVAIIGLAGCAPESPAPLGAGPESGDTNDAAAAERLDALVEEYFDALLEMNPLYATFIGDYRYNDRLPNTIDPEYRRMEEAMERHYLQAVQAIDEAQLDAESALTRAVFLRDRQVAIDGFQYPDHLLPLNQFFSMQNYFAVMGSGSSVHPFRNVEDYEDWLGRVDGFVVFMKQARDNMRAGVEQGIVQPRIVMERVIPQLEQHIVDDVESSVFFRPIALMPEEFNDADRQRLTDAYHEAIVEKIIPTYRETLRFVRDEYLPHTRESAGLGALPGGDDWYAYLVRTTTTTDLTPEQIHRIGLAEVQRIHGEMRGVIKEVGFEGDLQAFFKFLNEDPQFYFEDEQALLQGYRALREDVHRKALNLFHRLPAADYEIRAVEPFRARSASGGSYVAATPDGSRPGVFYVNTYDLSARPKWAMESLFLHEAVPGHHFQGGLALELEDLPRFRRFGGYTAFGEGWGLYAESLGKELGVYEDPYQYFGALNAELWRAVRLVVDTGLHHEGWTREQVLEYMYANTAVKETRAVSEAERYIAIPGQALAYKIGQLKIAELRAEAEAELGERFDIKEFHAQVLGAGELPLDVLEEKIDRWIARNKDS